jgi:hypothetical protein
MTLDEINAEIARLEKFEDKADK